RASPASKTKLGALQLTARRDQVPRALLRARSSCVGLPSFAAVSTPDTAVEPASESAPAIASADFMIEVDGKLVPNYDATMVSFKEGDVVSGKVVRIDQDEVLVDIGYKSEGVIPSNELSIRKAVD